MLRALVVGTVGLLIAGFLLVTYASLQTHDAPAAKPRTVSLIVAAHPVRAGSLLQPGDLGAREVPADQVPSGASIDDAPSRSALVGAMVRRMLDEHDVIAARDVLRPGDRGFLAAVLQPGTRAVSVAVDAVSGEAGLIWPGDRVDLILTQTIDGTDQSPAHRVAGETVLADVRVIAVDQQLVQGGQASGLIEGRAPSSRTITLEVTPQNAARIAVATRLGKLQVVLRAAGPEEDGRIAAEPPAATPAAASSEKRLATSGSGTVWGGDVSRALGPDSRARSPEVRLFQGTKPVEAYRF